MLMMTVCVSCDDHTMLQTGASEQMLKVCDVQKVKKCWQGMTVARMKNAC